MGVNQTLGNSATTLGAHAAILRSDGLGEIRIETLPLIGDVALAGIAIRPVVPPLVGVDFDEHGAGPMNWNQVTSTGATTLTDLIDEHAGTTQMDLVIESESTLGLRGGPVVEWPIHTQTLERLDGQLLATGVENTVLRWTDLVAGATYEVFVFGGGQAEQRVTIQGRDADIVFEQLPSVEGVLVNRQLANSGRVLGSYRELVRADDSGQIVIDVQPMSESIEISGVAIRQVAPPEILQNQIVNVITSPDPPARLVHHEFVRVSFDYTTNEPDGIVIVATPLSAGGNPRWIFSSGSRRAYGGSRFWHKFVYNHDGKG